MTQESAQVDQQVQSNLLSSHANYMNEVRITEMLESCQQSQEQNGEHYRGIVEEPLDFIFEPEHQNPKERLDKGKTETDSPSTLPLKEPTPTSESQSESHFYKRVSGLDSKFKFATSIREINGILEYEYKSYSFKQETDDFNVDDLVPNKGDILCFNEMDLTNESHFYSNIRGISISKFPSVGFGFELDKQTIGNESFIYVKSIATDSPAEAAMRLGDIILELDEMSLNEETLNNIDQINKYLNDENTQTIHLIVVHESKYFRLKSENNDLLKNYHKNCEDIVIVSWKKNIE